MIKRLYILFLLAHFGSGFAQNCASQFVTDSLYRPEHKKSFLVSVLNCPLKNGGNVQIINNSGKFVLKLTLHEKLGFLDVGPLQIKSGSKSFFVKSATLYDKKEPDAYFLVDVLINYIATLKDDGITSVVFNEKFEASLAGEDTKNIRRTAKCFYELNKK
ncbi:MAG TPA: hypothetical protein VN026_06005 [Bacteroidia bacterium]|jgi:hypothetical protein|nr:hypothetical protein [Bacteroidia bacterium]